MFLYTQDLEISVKDKKISEYSLYELLELRPDYERQYFDDDSIYIVSGHTPTKLISGKWEIYHSHNNIVIDCGAAFGGRLACLRLEDMAEFYV
ncbi:Calcineurin-like phosphoesterase [human gut metagenome]|uniref:Calcineurin-like phosphoesterase n=1 Tax=human gut metagenome TaxID=408170 RepID=K1TQM9_9ZZZZ